MASDKVLVVEDNLTNQLIAKAMLTKLGFQVVLASDGYAAIELAAGNAFKVIFMDCHMPMLNGFHTTQRMREREIKSPIIGFTTGVDQQERKRYASVGVSEFLIKPYSEREMKTVITKVLDGFQLTKVGPIDEMLTSFGKEAVLQILKAYEVSLDELEKKLSLEATAKEMAVFKALAHQFKSSSLAVGEQMLADFCMKIESSEHLSDAKNHSNTLLGYLPVARSKMSALIQRIKSENG